MTIVTTKIEGIAYGATVNAFTSVSIDPPLVLVSLDRRSNLCGRLAGRPFVVNVLERSQESLAWMKAVEMTGTKDFRGVQSRIGEVIAWQHLFEGLSDAAIRDHREWENGTLLPSTKYGMIYRWFMQVGYSRVKEIIEQDVPSALVYMNSSSADFKNPEIPKYLDKYARGSNGFDAEARMKLMNALWDSIGSEFGGRHELYERNYAGNHEGVRVELYGASEATGNSEGMRSFVDRFLSEYDLDGWTSPDLKSFDELRTNTFTSIHSA